MFVKQLRGRLPRIVIFTRITAVIFVNPDTNVSSRNYIICLDFNNVYDLIRCRWAFESWKLEMLKMKVKSLKDESLNVESCRSQFWIQLKVNFACFVLRGLSPVGGIWRRGTMGPSRRTTKIYSCYLSQNERTLIFFKDCFFSPQRFPWRYLQSQGGLWNVAINRWEWRGTM